LKPFITGGFKKWRRDGAQIARKCPHPAVSMAIDSRPIRHCKHGFWAGFSGEPASGTEAMRAEQAFMRLCCNAFSLHDNFLVE
jgi:hypothetical protein